MSDCKRHLLGKLQAAKGRGTASSPEEIFLPVEWETIHLLLGTKGKLDLGF